MGIKKKSFPAFIFFGLIYCSGVTMTEDCMESEVCGIIGWFFTVSCEGQSNEVDEFPFEDNDTVMCSIAVEGKPQIDVSIELWEDSDMYWETFSFEPELEGKNVNITWVGNGMTMRDTRVIKALNLSSCPTDDDGENINVNIKESAKIFCSLPCMKRVIIPNDSSGGVKVTWYRDDKPLEIDGNYTMEPYVGAFVLTIYSVSLVNAPGTYICEMERNGIVISTGEKKKLCVTSKYTRLQKATIIY